jgi:hypothetical protein
MVDAIWLLGLPAAFVLALIVGDFVARALGFDDDTDWREWR